MHNEVVFKGRAPHFYLRLKEIVRKYGNRRMNKFGR